MKKIGRCILLFVVCFMSFYYIDNYNKEIHVKEEPKVYEASLAMVGDALIHDAVYNSAKTSNGYDFKPMLTNLKEAVKNYDLRYYNQETILGGSELGLSTYPRFNSPYEVGDAFLDAGFNLVSLANNHTMDKGEIGVINSRNYWDSKDVLASGSYISFEQRNNTTIKEMNGITYTFLSYTTCNNGLNTPDGKEYLNNEYDKELVVNEINKVRPLADIVIVAMHWGNEYSHTVSDSQREIANYLSELGVDIVIGTHPHVVEPIEFIGKTMVIYSLGNIISAQKGVNRLTGLLATIKIRKTVDNGLTIIELLEPTAELFYTDKKDGFKLYTYSQLDNSILNNYEDHYKEFISVVVGDNGIVKPIF